MSENPLEEIFRQAAAIAKCVPENLQEAAFNRAVEQLLSIDGPPRGSSQPARRRLRQEKQQQPDAIHSIVDAINRTKHPDVGATSRVADRALKVLQLANDDYGVDGLTAPQIAEILTVKFRLPVKTNAVAMALAREVNTVDVRKGPSNARVFHIMAPGEEYLRTLRGGTEARARRKPKKKQVIKKGAPSPSKSKKGSPTQYETGKKKESKGTRSSGRPGPKAAIALLVDAGFFQTPRVISEVQAELKHRRGNHYSLQELAPALVRSLRDKTLDRERNGEGQYEYTEA